MLGPVIEGERIRLEPPRAEHLATYGRWFEDMEVTRYLLYRNPFTHKGRRGLERAGYRQCGLYRRHFLVDGQWHDMWIGEIFKDDWEAQEGRA
jgi:hypothetical protein